VDTHTLTLITIVAETVLEDRIARDLLDLGATGYTVTEAHGKGTRGIRTAEIPGNNVRIETVVAPAVADRILERVREKWFPHYAVIAWSHDVEVVRGEKYRSTGD